MKQLTLMPILDGSVFVNSQVVNDPVLLSVLTDLMTETTNSQPKKSNAGTSTQSKDSHVLPEDIAKAIAYLEYRRLRHKHPHV